MFLKTLYPRMNKPNLHNNIISTSSFQNGLSDLLSSTDFYFESKVIKDSHYEKIICIFYFGAIRISVAVRIYKIHVFDELFFPINCQNVYDHKTFRLVTCYEEFSSINMNAT